MSDELDPIARRAARSCKQMNALVASLLHPSIPISQAAELLSILCPNASEREAIIRRQQAKGVAKYGTTVSRANLTPAQWREHAKQEAADLLVYLIAEEEARKQEAAATPDREGSVE